MLFRSDRAFRIPGRWRSRVTGEDVVEGALESIAAVEGVRGCMAVCGDRVAVCGDVPELIPANVAPDTIWSSTNV